MSQLSAVDDATISKIGGMAVAAASVQMAGDASFLLLPPGYNRVDITREIEQAHPVPYRKRGTIALTSIDSFNEFVKDQARERGSYIYADPESRTLTAVFNDHEYGDCSTDAGWRDFRAVYTAELSREFSTWLKNNKQPKDQEEFAIFLEDNIADIAEPAGETLLQIALTLQAKTEVNFNSSRRLDNGQVQITYTENIDARAAAGSIEIPREFAIGCRLFKNGEGYKIRARLKYRLGGGHLKFWYELDRPENAIEDAFNAYVEKAKEAGVKILIGKA